MSIKGDNIPLPARLTSIADTFDILTHSRPYKSASTLEEALAEIQKERGRQFDPALVDALLQLASARDLLQLDQALLETEPLATVSGQAISLDIADALPPAL